MTTNTLSRRLVDELIKYLSSGGIIRVNLSQPNLTACLSKQVLRYIARHNRGREYKRLIRYMRQQNLVSMQEQEDGRTKINLAHGGVKRAQKITLNEMAIPKPRRWDRKWRMVLFDIPETHRQARNALAIKLRELGFYQLQKSAWIHPFPCLIEIEFIKHAYSIVPYVTLAEIDRIDKREQLVRRFQHILP